MDRGEGFVGSLKTIILEVDIVWKGTTYVRCFQGDIAISQMIDNGIVEDVESAIKLANSLMDDGAIECVHSPEMMFVNGIFFYRFVGHDDDLVLKLGQDEESKQMGQVSASDLFMLPEEVRDIAKELKNDLDKIGKLQASNVFAGRDAVESLTSLRGTSKEESLQLGQLFLVEGWIQSRQSNPFKNDKSLYRFVHELDQDLDMNALNSRRQSIITETRVGNLLRREDAAFLGSLS